MFLSHPDRTWHLNRFMLLEKQCYYYTHIFILKKSSIAFSLCVFALLQKENTNSYTSDFIKMPASVTLSTLNFIHFLLVYFSLLACPTQCLESNLSLKSLGKPYIFRRLKAKQN